MRRDALVRKPVPTFQEHAFMKQRARSLFGNKDGAKAPRREAFALKPASIVAAAEADLALRARQCGIWLEGEGWRPQPYCFYRAHVARASCALDLINRAIADRYSGVHAGKRITRIIYGDETLLWEARALLSPLALAAHQPECSRQEGAIGAAA
jgi:hypothetical protein